MDYLSCLYDERIVNANKNKDIFYALQTRITCPGENTSKNLYTFCLPTNAQTLMLFNGLTPKDLAGQINHVRNEFEIDFFRIDVVRPESIPTIEKNEKRDIVFFDDLNIEDRKVFLEALVKYY